MLHAFDVLSFIYNRVRPHNALLVAKVQNKKLRASFTLLYLAYLLNAVSGRKKTKGSLQCGIPDSLLIAVLLIVLDLVAHSGQGHPTRGR